MSNHNMNVRVYASLKDYFPQDFSLEGRAANTEELKARLLEMNGEAGKILEACRFAVGTDFIDHDFKLQENDTVIILPPGSGG